MSKPGSGLECQLSAGGTAWDSVGTVMRKGPRMDQATNQQGRLMRHHGLGLVYAQPHK